MASPVAPNTGQTAFYRRLATASTIGKMVGLYGLLILLGAVALWLPVTHRPGVSIGFLDALFVATSAACVTGLSTVNVGETFSPAGEAVLLGLIQLGGLGIMTAGTLFLLYRGRGLSSRGAEFIGANVGRLRSARPLDIFIYALVLVLSWEAFGTVALTYLIVTRSETADFGSALWEAAFHSVSAFCNAGISTYPEGLLRWRDDPLVLGVFVLLVVAGGIGLMTLVNFRYYYWWRRDRLKRGQLTLQTRICLLTSAGLLLWGTLFTLAGETDHTLKEQPLGSALGWSLFHSAMTRTAGYNVVDLGQMSPSTLFGSLPLMLIGGSPGSMAGGIKVTTFVLLALSAWTALRRRSQMVLGRATLPASQAHTSVMLLLVTAAILFGTLALLLHTEAGQAASRTPHGWLAVIFEAVSAFATVGLSTGITGDLTPAGKGLIMLLMFVGRLAPLCLAMHLAQPPLDPRIQFPEEEVAVG
jgi:trk system potassium uptake protein TrkH